MKISKLAAGCMAMAVLLTACGKTPTKPQNTMPTPDLSSVTEIVLSDESITTTGTSNAVYTANDIVYYQSGMDFTYGEGTEADAHSAEDAAAHTVIHISQPGAYRISGTLSRGQIAVDLGDGADEDPTAVVTLILNGVDITCEVAPAIIFYNVYECGSDDADSASKDVDTSSAGANVIIADGTVNTVNGSYVARIYKPDSVVLNKAGTEVEDAKKLHKYDSAFYSKMSMNVFGGEENTGVLTINAENEGLDSELHLTVNGGTININSGNDGINTNEDGVSVTTINGGTVIATGHMLDHIQDGGQTYAVFNFIQEQDGNRTISLKNKTGKALLSHSPTNSYSVLVYSSPDLTADTYTLWNGETQLLGQSGGTGGIGMPPNGMQGMPDWSGEGTPPDHPEGANPPDRPEGAIPPDWETQTDRPEPPADGQRPERPDGQGGEQLPSGGGATSENATMEFNISIGANMFAVVFPSA